MPSVMDINECHLCKSHYPIDAGTYSLRTGTVREEFEGMFHLILHAAQQQGDGSEASSAVSEKKYEDRVISTEFFVKYNPTVEAEVFFRFIQLVCFLFSNYV